MQLIEYIEDNHIGVMCVVVITFQTIFAIVVLTLHTIHNIRASKNHKKLKAELNYIHDRINKITNELMPYLEGLAKQRDRYKSKLKD